MRSTVFLIAFFIITSFLSAQSISEPLRQNKNVLVSSAGLPEEYLLFAPDTATQILFNPARGADYNGNFIYINYYSDNSYSPVYLTGLNINTDITAVVYETGLSKTTGTNNSNIYSFPSISENRYSSSSNPSFSIASLINCGTAKWLITFTNGILNDKTSTDYTSSTYKYDPASTKESTEGTNTHSTVDAMTSTIKISRITGNGQSNYSLGVWGTFVHNQGNYTSSKNSSFINTYSQSSASFNSNESINYSELDRTIKEISTGVEFSFNNKSTDYIASLGYNYSKAPFNVKSLNQTNSLDTSYSNNGTIASYRSSIQQTAITGYSGGSMNGLSLYNYLSHSAGWLTPQDNFFISLYGYFCEGDINFNNQYDYKSIYTSSSTTNNSANRITQYNKFKGKDRGIYLTTGYAARIMLNDIYLMSGVKLQGVIRETIDLTGGPNTGQSNDFAEFKYNDRTAAFILPVYINYFPVDWFSVYGGVNFTYRYSFNKYDLSTFSLRYNLINPYYEVNGQTNSDGSRWNSSKNIYAGFELKHSSGLRVQTFFTSEFTDLKYWNVSVGYNF